MSKKKGQKKTAKKPQKLWSFPTVSKCPRCGSTDTICRNTNITIGRQYRQCQRAVCRHRYSIDGKKV